jgi:holo-[acyl-carrier protein] synthase
MIYGIGCDIIEIFRITAAVERWGNRFLKRIFSDEELNYCYSASNEIAFYQRLAGKFAAKEAVIKALKTNSPLSQVEIINDLLSGIPEVRLKEKLQSLMRRLQITSISVSISHNRKYALAYAVVEREISF